MRITETLLGFSIMITITLIAFSVVQNKLAVFAPGGILPSVAWNRGEQLEKQVEKIIHSIFTFTPSDGYLEQLHTVSNNKDITIVYYFLIPAHRIQQTADWVSSIGSSDFIYAVQRLQWKIEYTNIVYSLLPTKFTLGELQKIYEAILHRTLDKRNFRKKILSLKMLKDTKMKKTLGRARPAEVYTFVKRHPTIVEIL